jgi:hypothetical protein
MIARGACLLITAYSAMLVAVGLAGILTARWELTRVFHFDPGQWPDDVRATFLNQYRFLKAIEFASGLACLTWCRAILSGGRAGRVFLVLVGGGIAARSIAWIGDGRPAPLFLGFLAAEVLVFAVTMLHFATRTADV